MRKTLRLSLFVLALGIAISVGTVIAGAIPLTVSHDTTITLDGYEQKSVFRERLLYARSYRLILQVQQGNAIEFTWTLISNEVILERSNIINLFEFGVLPTRGYYTFTFTNPHATPAEVRISLALTGSDHQQLLWGQSLFLLGFTLTIIHAIYEWKQPS